MKTLIAAGLALALLGGTAAEAAPFHRDTRAGIHSSVRVDFAGPRRGFARHGIRHSHRFVRGERLPPRFGRYVPVNDWQRARLRRPPRGYQWVRYGDDYLLAAIASGIIADILLNAYAR